MTTGQTDPALFTLLVFLALGGVAVYVAYRNQALGAALLVGVGVVTLLYLVAANPPEPRPSPGRPRPRSPPRLRLCRPARPRPPGTPAAQAR